MSSNVYKVTKQEYFSDEKKYVVSGSWPLGAYAEAYLDSKPLSISVLSRERISLFEQSVQRDGITECRISLSIQLPEDFEESRILVVFAVAGIEKRVWFSSDIKTLSVTDEKTFVTDKVLLKCKNIWNRMMHTSEKRIDEIMRNAISVHESKLPFFSIILTKTDLSDLEKSKLKRSLQNQNYPKWELFSWEDMEQFSKHMCKNQLRGDYLIFWNPADRLIDDALYEIAFAITLANVHIDILYGDDDQLTNEIGLYQNPRFKPDFNLEYLRAYNYIGRFFVARKDFVLDLLQINVKYRIGEEYDYFLRCAESHAKVYHIPIVLSHMAADHDKKETGKNVLQEHYNRLGLPVKVEDGHLKEIYRSKYNWNEKPRISIIIPNKDHVEDLKKCIDSIENKSSYSNYEYIIVENNSVKEETFLFYEHLQKENPKIKVISWNGPFNYSAINNYGVRFATGEYYLLLNNDTAIINADCIEELLGCCMQKDVGAVGGRLYYDDNTIQHAGVIVGLGGIAGHAFTQCSKEDSGYMNRIICQQEYSALTAACLMVKKSVFEEVGGLSEDLAVAFNDVDFCLKVRAAGYRIIYNPYAELYHYESKSRGSEDTPEKVERFHGEIRTFEKRWQEILLDGDPSYNKNLTLDGVAFLYKSY